MVKSGYNKVLYVVLGHSCNFHCRYCFGGHSFEKRSDFSHRIIPVINNFDGFVTFYGGEPFLYFDTMKKIVLASNRTVKFASMTNGSLITADIVKFLNRYNFCINFSWDGYNTKFTRLIDVVDYNWRNLVNINNLWLDSVISKYNYPKDAMSAMAMLNENYHKVHGYHCEFFINPVIKCYDNDFFDIDCERIRREMELILDKPSNYPERYLVNYIKINFGRYTVKSNILKCGAGIGGMAISPDGKMYLCKNSSKVLCDLDDIALYRKLVLENDINIRQECIDCSISEICRGGCRINRFREHFCKIQKAFFEPVVDFMRREKMLPC